MRHGIAAALALSFSFCAQAQIVSLSPSIPVTQSQIANLNGLTSPVRITLVYGQSRANNQSGANDVCYPPTSGTHLPIRSFMMNNPGQPGLNNKADFLTSTATGLIPYQSCLGTNLTGPAGQDLGQQIIYLQTDDDTFTRGANPRLMLVTGEGGQPIATLSKGANPLVDDNAEIPITQVGDNGSGLIRLTVCALNDTICAAQHIKTCAIGVAPCTQSTAIVTGTKISIGANGAGSFIGCSVIANAVVAGTATWTPTVIDATHIDLQGTSSTGCAKGDGTTTIGFVGGFVVYQRMINAVTQACVLTAVVGKTCAVETIDWLQGENDPTTSVASYTTSLTTLISNMRTDLAAITGQGTAIEFIINQPVAQGAGTALNSTIAQYNMIVANADGHTWGNGPEYAFPYSTTEHQTPAGVVQDGELFGFVRSGIIQGTFPSASTCSGSGYLCPISAVLAGSVVTVTLNVPTGCVTLDTTTLPAAVNNGFVWTDDSGKTISSVTVTDCTHISVALSGTPTTTKSLAYATSGPGGVPPLPPAWGNYRDGRQTTSRYVAGVLLSNWMLSWNLSL